MIIVRKDGKQINVEFKGFDNEDELRNQLLKNLNIIPVKDISNGEDERIIAWRTEFPLNVGSIDIIGVGNGGGIYIIETKLYKNSDRRKVIAQTLDYAAGLWELYAQRPEAFLEKLREKGEIGEIEEELYNAIAQNLSNANYNILVAMDSVATQTKSLIEFLNRHTDFRVLALELERYIGEGIEVILPKIYGEEITKSQLPPLPWPPEKLREAFSKISDEKLSDRLFRMLDFALENYIFEPSRTEKPGFSFGRPNRKILGVNVDGSLYAHIGVNEKYKYHSEESWLEFVGVLKRLGLLSESTNISEIKSGRTLERRVQELTEEEFNELLSALVRTIPH